MNPMLIKVSIVPFGASLSGSTSKTELELSVSAAVRRSRV